MTLTLERAILDLPEDEYAPRGHIECPDGTIFTFWSKSAGYQGVAGLLARGHVTDAQYTKIHAGIARAGRLPERKPEIASVYYTPEHVRQSWGKSENRIFVRVIDAPGGDPLTEHIRKTRSLIHALPPTDARH